MKKMMMIITAGLVAAISAQAQTLISRGAMPDTNNVVNIENTFADTAVPKLIYTELTGTTTNAVTMAFIPAVSTNAVDYGKVYRIGIFSTVGNKEVPIVLNDPLNVNSAGSVVLKRGDVLRLTGAGGTNRTNVYYRIIFEVK